MRFAVDERLDGHAGGVVWLEPWCVGTDFRAGERYLVSSSDQLPMPDGSATPIDGHVWFTDPYAVAWRLPGEGKAVLMGYGDGSLRDAPPWLIQARSLEQAVATVLPDPSSPVPAVTATVEDETFRLTIATDRATYTTSDIIPVAATLQMLRAEPTTITGSGRGPVLFGIEQFWIAFYNDADLVLPAGHYRVFALVEYGIDECTAHSSELMAEVLVEVIDPAAMPSPGPA